MTRILSTFLMLTFFSFFSVHRVFSQVNLGQDRILGAVQKMESSFKSIEDYTCEAEVIYYQNGVEEQHYRFKFYFKKVKKIRVDFSQPYPGLTVFYQGGEKEATVKPFRFMPSLRFRLSLDNPLIKTPAGQQIDQTDMGHFIEFVSRNLKQVKQKDGEFQEDDEQVRFWLWAMDYIKGESLEKYHITLSKKHWLPILIGRYHLEGHRLETTEIKNYRINAQVDERLFKP